MIILTAKICFFLLLGTSLSSDCGDCILVLWFPFSCLILVSEALMVVRALFLRWDIIRNPSVISKRRALYYLETAQAVDQCWHMKDFSLPVIPERLPRSVKKHCTPFSSPLQKQVLSLTTILQTLGIKFTINITDPTATIDATVFPKVAEQIYGITGSNIAIDTPDQPLSAELLDKLTEPKTYSITLKAYMYNLLELLSVGLTCIP
ncbi:hypothetical protein RHGRI_013117 [Rhododendron griersonianum]|uniref:Uncharacterized protein n=1 Tax=Rhododendron griersonianum TaxID=479676 RepID=A0AAV6K4K7_9ERIC|nr:hypothetical protein RHGRI_013117 [Rhododendron griersonianum]